MTTGLQPGEHTELKITQQARHRVICGLRWDPMEQGPGIGERLKGIGGHNVKSYDLDLFCVMYNDDGEFVDGVSGEPAESADDSGKVYHSGDDTSGHGDNDDEQISVELKDLPDYIHHIVFVAEIQSAHTFGDVVNPEIRIADGMTDDDILLVSLGRGADSERSACVFAHIYRQGEGWMLHHISDYLDVSDVGDWTKRLTGYISVPTAQD